MKIEMLLLFAMAGFVAWYIMKNKSSSGAGATTTTVSPAQQSIADDEGIVTRPQTPSVTSPTAPQIIYRDRDVYVAGINPDKDIVGQIGTLKPNTPYATMKGYVYRGATGTTFTADGVGSYIVSGYHRVVTDPSSLGYGEYPVPKSGGGFYVCTYDELPLEFLE